MKIYFLNNVKRWLVDSSGATAMEYALLAAGIALVIVASVFLLGADISALFGNADTTMQSAGARIGG